MFTGIVEGTGRLLRAQASEGGGKRLVIQHPFEAGGVALGDSVATSGVCLTATELGEGLFIADAGPETLARTTLGALHPGARLNLERSVTPATRMGGHLVMGHVDAVGQLLSIQQRENAVDLVVSAPAEALALIIERGSVCVDGVSLTVTGREAGSFSLSIIPHSLKETTLAELSVGDAVNVECDVIARYVAAMVRPEADPEQGQAPSVLEQLLRDW